MGKRDFRPDFSAILWSLKVTRACFVPHPVSVYTHLAIPSYRAGTAHGMQDSLGDTGDNCPHLGYSFSCLPSGEWRQETREKPAELVMLRQEPTRTWTRERGQLYHGIELRPSGEALSEVDISGNN